MPFARIGVFNEEDGFGTAADDNALAGVEVGALLAVAENRGSVVDEDGGDEHRGIGRDDDGAERETVWTDGGNAEGIDIGADDRTTGGDVVGSAATGGRNDDPIAEVSNAGPPAAFTGVLSVGGDFEFDHVKWRAGGDDGVVQSGGDKAAAFGDFDEIAVAALGFGRKDGGFEGQAGADGELSGDHLLEMVFELGGREAGEETEPAEVNAQERNLTSAEAAGGGKEGPVAAEDQDDVGIGDDWVGLVFDVNTDELGILLDRRDNTIQGGDDGRFSLVRNDKETHWASMVTRLSG